MSLDFPNNPAVGQQFPAGNGITYTFDGLKWTVFAGSGGGAGSGSFVGPVTIGQPALSPAPKIATMVADQAVLRISPAGQAQVGFNEYTGADQGIYYVDNGPGAHLDVHTTNVAGQTMPRFSISLSANNTAGPGASANQTTGAMNFVAATDGSGNIAPYVMLGPPGDPLTPSPMQNTLIADQISMRSGTVGVPAGDISSKLQLNLYTDIAGAWRYVGNGAGASITSHQQSNNIQPMARFSIALADINNAGSGALAQPAGGTNHLLGALHIVNGDTSGGIAPFVVVGQQPNIPYPYFPMQNTLVADHVSIRSITSSRPDNIASLGFNVYYDTADIPRFLVNGPGGTINCHDFGTGISRFTIGPFDENTGGPGAPATFGAAGLNVVAGAPGTGMPYIVTGTVQDIPTAGLYPEYASILCHGTLVAGADPLPGATDRVTRIGLNMFQQGYPAGGAWVYYKDGPAGNITTHDANEGAAPLPYENIRFSVLPAAPANTQTGSPPCFIIMTQTAATLNSTNIMLYANPSGTPTLKSVFVGAPGTGPNGGCALYVAP